MHVIYGCYGGAHSSPVAAAVHLGHLPVDRVPTPHELMDVHLFDQADNKTRGKLLYAGTDDAGNDVYVFARGSEAQAMERALISGIRLAGGDETLDVKFVDTLKAVNFSMRVGGFLSRAVGWVSLGRPIVIWGTRRAYKDLVDIVQGVKDDLRRTEGVPVGMAAGRDVKRRNEKSK